MTDDSAEDASADGASDGDASFNAFLRDAAHLSLAGARPLQLAPGTLVAGKFRVERCIGFGGMGAVYAVRHELTRHRRALKMLHAECGARPDIVRRFLAEASAAGRAGSPHLVETFDVGTLPSGEPYLVMELLNGMSLGELLERDGRLDAALACELVCQAAEGIDAAHRANIVHRDLKPDNLFVVERPEGRFVKVLDFGISKFNSASLMDTEGTQAGAVFGTPAFMAPEQFRSSRDADARADVFALGAVLFACLGGEAPYDAPSLPAIGTRLLMGQATALPTLRPDLDSALTKVVHRAIAANPDARIQTARALIDALAPFRGQPECSQMLPPQVTSTPPSFVWRWAASLAVGGLMALVASLLWWRLTPGVEPIVSPAREVLELPRQRDAEAPSLVQAPEQVLPPGDEPPRTPESRKPPTTKLVSPPTKKELPAPEGPSRSSSLGLVEENPFR